MGKAHKQNDPKIYFTSTMILIFRTQTNSIVYFLLGISPASVYNMPTFWNHVSVPSSKAGSTVYFQPLKMELTHGSETSEYYILTPGKYPKEHVQYSNHGESLKSTVLKKTLKKIVQLG